MTINKNDIGGLEWCASQVREHNHLYKGDIRGFIRVGDIPEVYRTYLDAYEEGIRRFNRPDLVLTYARTQTREYIKTLSLSRLEIKTQ